jgi:AraC-like DNA-binding protein
VQTLITTILFQAGLNIFLFWSNRKRNSDDFYLIVLMSLFLIHTGFKYLLWLISPDYNTFDKIHGCFSLLTGPYMLFYLNTISGKPTLQVLKKYHFLPFMLGFVLNVITLVDVLALEDFAYLEHFHQIMTALVLMSMTGYGSYILARLKLLGGQTDEATGYKLKIVRMISIFLLMPGFIFVVGILTPLPHFVDRRIWYVAMIIMMTGVLNYRFKISGITKAKEEPGPAETRKYQHSTLSSERMQQIADHINQVMKLQKPYLNTEFSLEDLAAMMSIPKHHITEVLNSALHINFYKFVNQYRVEESKRLIREMNTELNLMEIGLESGFKSKSTFNKYFKELTGSSPSEYARTVHEVLT